jgi:PAS domain S-box-containing protein
VSAGKNTELQTLYRHTPANKSGDEYLSSKISGDPTLQSTENRSSADKDTVSYSSRANEVFPMDRVVQLPACCENPGCFAQHPAGEQTNDALRSSDARYRMIADCCPTMMWVIDSNGDIQSLNRACREFYGIESESMNRDQWKLLFHPDDRTLIVEPFDLNSKEYNPFSVEARARRADGAWRRLGWRADPIFSPGGEFQGYISLCADITERTQAEQERQFELSLIQSIHAETQDGILVVNQARIVVSYNKRFLDIWGLEDSTVEGPSPHSFVGLDYGTILLSIRDNLIDPEFLEQRVHWLFSHPDEKDFSEIKLKDGRTLERHSTGLRNSDGLHLGRVWFFRDITSHKQTEVSLQRAYAVADEANQRLLAERSLLENEREMLRALIDNIPDFMYIKDLQSRFVVANAHLASIVGAGSPEELTGKTDYDYYPREMADAFFADELNLIQSGQSMYNHEEKGLDASGNETHVLTTKVLLRDSNQQIIGIAGVGRDISLQKNLEKDLREAEQKYRGIFDKAVIGIFQSTPDGSFLSVNPSMAFTFGYDSPEEMTACISDMTQHFFANPKRGLEFMLVMDRVGGVKNFECEAVRKDNSKVWVAMSIRAIRENSAVVRYEGMCEDITERKEMEAALREAEQKYRGIFDMAVVGIFQSTMEGRFLSVNPTMARTLHYDSPEDMIISITDMSRQFYVDPKRRDQLTFHLKKSSVLQNFECEVYCKDGAKIWLAISAVEIRENDVVVRFEGMCEDITERNLLRDQLLQAQKLESVGQLAAGIAHEINTPTQYIGDNTRFLKDAFQDLKNLLGSYERLMLAAKSNTLSGSVVAEIEAAVKSTDADYLLDEIPKAIEQTLEGVTRVATLVSAMKEFSHPDTKEKVPLDLNRSINSTITVARNEWKYVSDLETDFDSTLPMISCLPGEFNQVILNLIVNASHAIAEVIKNGGPERGKITVQTRNCAGWAEIRIQDTGTGIPEKVRARIFDPFFTTKEIGKGTGQGLAIARSVVVDKHGGSIHFETEEGKGTTFIIRLPYDGKPLSTKAVAA